VDSRIVFATEADVPAILAFIRGIAEYEKLSHEVVATEEILRESLFGPRRNAEVLFIESDGERVGYAVFFHSFSTFLGVPGIYLEDLYIRPEHRGRGYGRKLFSFIAALAVERGCGRLEWSVLNWNTPALEFYRSLGAVSQSEWTMQRLSGEALRRFQKPASRT